MQFLIISPCPSLPPLFRLTLTSPNGSLQTWVGISQEDIVLIWYGGELDQLLMTKWSSSNVPVSFNSYFSGCIYYKGCHWGRNFWKLLPTGTSDSVAYSSQQTDIFVTINLDDQILRKIPGYNQHNIMVACLPCHRVLCTKTYPCFCGWEAIKQNRENNGPWWY